LLKAFWLKKYRYGFPPELVMRKLLNAHRRAVRKLLGGILLGPHPGILRTALLKSLAIGPELLAGPPRPGHWKYFRKMRAWNNLSAALSDRAFRRFAAGHRRSATIYQRAAVLLTLEESPLLGRCVGLQNIGQNRVARQWRTLPPGLSHNIAEGMAISEKLLALMPGRQHQLDVLCRRSFHADALAIKSTNRYMLLEQKIQEHNLPVPGGEVNACAAALQEAIKRARDCHQRFSLLSAVLFLNQPDENPSLRVQVDEVLDKWAAKIAASPRTSERTAALRWIHEVLKYSSTE
jgi:hypothetical protein